MLFVMSAKDFEGWYFQKLLVQAGEVQRYFYEREVWWTVIGSNIGFEEDGKGKEFIRPVIILRKYNEHFFLGIPTSSVAKTGRYYYAFETSPGYVTALLSQIRAFDSRRLLRKDGMVSGWDYSMIRLRLIAELSRNSVPPKSENMGGEVETHL